MVPHCPCSTLPSFQFTQNPQAIHTDIHIFHIAEFVNFLHITSSRNAYCLSISIHEMGTQKYLHMIRHRIPFLSMSYPWDAYVEPKIHAIQMHKNIPVHSQTWNAHRHSKHMYLQRTSVLVHVLQNVSQTAFSGISTNIHM